MFHRPCTNKVAVHHGHCTKPTRIEYQWWCRIYRHCKRSVSLSFSRNLGSSNKTHGLFTDLYYIHGFSRAFSAPWRAPRGGGRGKKPFDLQIASRFPSFLNASLFSSFAHLLLYAECNYPNCRHSKHSALR